MQKDRILDALRANQVIVVQSPTGSGKTTQIPVILHEAGYSQTGMIAVTQPRRIAAVSVSAFIAKQLGTTVPGTEKVGGLVGYKMRFDDKTDSSTKIKIMTDGILLQEMKLDPWLSRYTVVMVDEAHERSLNIDFVLGLLKRVLAERSDFRVIVSSATMNAEAFSYYFAGSGGPAPIVTIETTVYPVMVIYDAPLLQAASEPVTEKRRGIDRRSKQGAPPEVERRSGTDRRDEPMRRVSPSLLAEEALMRQIATVIGRSLDNREKGAILCFLPGERAIKECMKVIAAESYARRLWIVPLYGRLSREEQERVFEAPPLGKRKLVLSTNIAETSVTIPDVTVVIDSGLAKLSYYNPHSFTSSLVESPVSRASIDQRKGRAGRTSPGTAYRLYDRYDYESRPPYTTEEIYRTDLSEVALRMSELGILDFDRFDFISHPGREGIQSARDTLILLQALNDDNTLSKVGEIMARFPLIPRHSRIIVEAILRYPEVMEEVLIATAFLSAQSPYILPPGSEDEAREAHRRFREQGGDFASYVTLFRTFLDERDRDVLNRGKLPAFNWCDKNYLDYRVMGEIVNIKEQLEQIVGDLGLPIIAAGDITKADKMDAYLCCIASGMIQFVCIRDGRDYRSLTADHISIHPGSVLFRENPPFMVAGEIVRTSRMYAMSVSPLTRDLLGRVDPALENKLKGLAAGAKPNRDERYEQSKGSRNDGKRRSDKRKGNGESRGHKEAGKRSSKVKKGKR